MREGAHKQFAQAMRSEMTDAERRLWLHLRRKQLAGFRFRRQHSIGSYVADFACLEAKLVVEVDGSQHAQSLQDQHRDDVLQEFGFRVVRFWNNDVIASTDRVLADILQALASSSPLPASGHLPPRAGEGS
jgi:very-short-patch-repair endonuclease